MDIKHLAWQANLAINTKNYRKASELLGLLYRYIQSDSDLLLNLQPNNCQPVGLALTGMALLFDCNDEDINSVAAENAYYCLAKGYIGTQNTFCLPAIFTILQKRPKLLKDNFITYLSTVVQKELGMPIGLALGGNPYKSPMLEDFRAQALSHKFYVQQYVLSKIFDEKTKEYTIPKDIPYYLPSIDDINIFIQDRNTYDDILDNDKCKNVFMSIYKDCEESLQNFKL